MSKISICLMFFILNLIEIENLNNSLFLNDYTIDAKISKLFSKLLQRYLGFSLIFHAENNTVQYVNVVLNYFRHNITKNKPLTCFLVYNHDTLYSSQVFIRPNASHVINFLFTRNWNLWKMLAVPEKINSNDVVIFVAVGNGTVQEAVNNSGVEFLKLAGKTILLEIIPHHGVTFYKTCYYCGAMSMKYYFLEKTHNSKLYTPKSQFMPVSFKNLNNHKLRIIFKSYFPYGFCNHASETMEENGKIGLCYKFEGVENEMLRIISQKLNFSYDVYLMNSNSSFKEMIQYIHDRNADIAIGGISMTIDRLSLVQFTDQYNLEKFTFLYKFEINIKEVFIKFFEPFNAVTVWILYITIVAALSFLIYLASRLLYIRSLETSFIDSLAIIVRGVLEQPFQHLPTIYHLYYSTTLIIIIWWWNCLVLNTVYRSTVLSTVVNPSSLEPDNLEQLVNAGYNFIGNAEVADIVQDLMEVPDDLYKYAYNKMSFGKNTCDVFKKILQSQTAMLDETSTLQYEIQKMCPKPSRKVQKWLRIGRHAVRFTGHAWVVQRGAPYREAINYYLSLIISGGHFIKWKHALTMNNQKHLITKSREAKNKSFRNLSIKRILPLITIYLTGIIISCILFISELLFYFYFTNY